ncbi:MULTISPECIES: M15 family metallopeptidase [Sphingomonas]|uniref:M15 family metallopeptidase n=1 Tax=Sphingomonas paucimobilis TaxID=13689 RepID=A0A411LK89_SPHPI|nr:MULTISPECIES: M15 family metallopeptidase [Sphingomonas]MBQ1481018.1 M15 family metallopeptidase [Sphingomonas sp.]MCM3681334.1 M15 family metallopeptidase [Sphingomonas paucimobilis]MDG5969881.1 M15 family metallopeptidase [Sphingomonas paucimobilis]NNG59168.1 M15 family metallopeptidase [Sphingomonas paucimobilis]QBE92754.1 M15 family peptidase [Sphingomonas paucimobilis]
MRTPLPKAGTVNVGLTSPSSSEQITRFGGMPSAHMSQNDSPITNPQLKYMIATESVGPFRVTGLRRAIVSLRAVLAEVPRDLPDLLALLSSAGIEVNRLQRGSRTKVSNHAWGSAIDLRVDGTLVPFGASYSLKGLDALVPYFNRAGWYWGGGYRSAGRADPMHFELGSVLMKGITR